MEIYTIASGSVDGTNTFGFLVAEHFSIPFFLVILMGCRISTGGVLLILLFVVHRREDSGEEWRSCSWEWVLTISCCVESMVMVPLLFVLEGDEPPCCGCFSDWLTRFSCLWLFRQLYSRFRQPCPRRDTSRQMQKLMIKRRKALAEIMKTNFWLERLG